MQNPEKLYRERGFFAYAIVVTLVFVGLMFVEIPAVHEMLRFESTAWQSSVTIPSLTAGQH